MLVGDIWRDRAPVDAAPAGKTVHSGKGQTPSPGTVPSGNSFGEPYELQIPQAQGGSLKVPVYRGQVVDRGSDLSPSDRLNQELRRNGFQLRDDDPGVILLELENGEKILVPVENLRIEPSGQ